MIDRTKLKGLIGACDDADKLRAWIKNARTKGDREIEEVAFRRLMAILPKEQPGTIEHDFWRTIHVFEHLLTQERGKTTRLARTRQKVGKVGEIQTLKDWAFATKDTDGFEMLIERNMPELTGEAIVLRHAGQFPEDVVAAARRRLEDAGVDISTLPSSV